MKKIIALLALSLSLSTSAFALDDEIHAACTSTAALAEIIAQARYYHNFPMDESMALAKDSKIARALVLHVYSLPDLRYERNQAAAILAVRNEAYKACYESFKGE